MRGRGGFIGANVTPAASAVNSAASGVWNLREAEALNRAGTWPRSGLVYDAFTATNGTTLTGRTPSHTASGSNTWSTATWTSGGGVAACQIQNNQAQQLSYASSTNNNYSYVYTNCGTADVTVSGICVIGSKDYSYSYCGLVARFTPYAGNFAGSFITAQLFSNDLGSVAVGASLVLRSFNAGVITTLASSTKAIAYNTPYVVTLTCSGSNISCTWNGVTLTGTSTVNQSVASHGFFIGHTEDAGSGTQSYIDDLAIASP